MKQLIFFAAIISVIACNQEKSGGKNADTRFDTAYQTAVFADPGRPDSYREGKIRLAFPVIDSIYKKHAADNHFPGMAFGIVVDGKLAFTGNYGYTDIDEKTPVTSSSLFRIASMSKSFTCMAI